MNHVAGIRKIKHVVMITQENRSFDSYFGTFPGADVNGGGPHGYASFRRDYNHTRSDIPNYWRYASGRPGGLSTPGRI